jgi:hypothetical protein
LTPETTIGPTYSVKLYEDTPNMNKDPKKDIVNRNTNSGITRVRDNNMTMHTNDSAKCEKQGHILFNRHSKYEIQSKSSEFMIAHINIRSLRNKVHEVQLLMQKLSIDILCLTETWLNETIKDNLVSIPGYNITRYDRGLNTFGEVAIYIHDNIPFKLRNDLITFTKLEMIWIEIPYKVTESMLISCLYRPPSADVSYYDNIVDTFEKVSQLDKHFIGLGDLNYDYVLDETIYDNQVFMLEDMFLLKQLVSSQPGSQKTQHHYLMLF